MTEKISAHTKAELCKFTPTNAAIAVMAAEYMPLTINGIDDKDGYKKVHAARMVVKSKRVEIEKTRKELKKEALAFGRVVDGEAKRITEQLNSIEGYLTDQQAAVDDEKERIKQEELEAIRAKEEAERQAEIDRLAKIEEAERHARKKVIAEEEARLKAERERQAKVEAEQRKKAEELQAAQDKIEAEQKAIVEAEREAYEKRRLAEQAKAEAERQEALKPDKEKLIALSEVLSRLPLPEVKDAVAITVKAGVAKRLIKIIAFIEEFTHAK